MKRTGLRKESMPYIVFLALATMVIYYFFKVLAIIPFILLLFVVYFFRDPYRKIDFNENTIISPADGTIMDINEVDSSDFENGKAKKISIFLSLFNVHINRSPISGKVIYKGYRPGKYLPAFKSHASELNERNTICIENERVKVIVHQITGLVARRIVCWSNEGDILKKGEKFGLIKFGSCTELLVPTDIEIVAKKGDVVRGGLTVLGVIRDE